MIDTVLLDAGGVLLDESEQERIRAEVTVEALSPFVPGCCMADYWADVDDAVYRHIPRVYQYVLWKHCARCLETFEQIRVSTTRYGRPGTLASC